MRYRDQIRASSRLGDLWTPLEGVRKLVSIYLLLILPCLLPGPFSGLLCGLRGLSRQAERQRVPRSHRLISPNDHDIPQHTLQDCCLLLVRRRGTSEDPSKEPSRSVYAGEAKDLRHLGAALIPAHSTRTKFGTERSFHLLSGATIGTDRGGNLAPNLVPDPSAARGRESEDLQRGVPGHHGGRDDLLRLVYLDTNLSALSSRDEQGTQVKARQAIVGSFGTIPGTGARRQAIFALRHLVNVRSV
jgi:hypothetical protein